MASNKYNVAVVPVGRIEIVVIHVDAASCSTPEMLARSMKFFKARLLGKHVVLMYVDLIRRPVYLGPPNLVEALRGKGVNDLKWQKVAMV
jgi:hypothetical protein